MALADTPTENMERWKILPALKGYSKVKRAKAGALVLAEHPTDRNEFGNRIPHRNTQLQRRPRHGIYATHFSAVADDTLP